MLGHFESVNYGWKSLSEFALHLDNTSELYRLRVNGTKKTKILQREISLLAHSNVLSILILNAIKKVSFGLSH